MGLVWIYPAFILIESGTEYETHCTILYLRAEARQNVAAKARQY